MANVVFVTELGEVEFFIDEKRAPITAKNFLRYVALEAYNGTSFYRTVTTKPDNQPDKTVKIDVIQGGPPDDAKGFPPIALERTNKTGIKHKDGVISMARDTPDSATSAIFICVGNQPSLDFGGKRNPDGQGFAAFGKVVRGMDVVRRIHQSKSEEQALKPAIGIKQAYIKS